MAKKKREPEEIVEQQDRDAKDLEEEEGELLPDREAMSILPLGDEFVRGPLPDVK
jgi:hypothetical protein